MYYVSYIVHESIGVVVVNETEKKKNGILLIHVCILVNFSKYININPEKFQIYKCLSNNSSLRHSTLRAEARLFSK